jgi:hypothetical protein
LYFFLQEIIFSLEVPNLKLEELLPLDLAALKLRLAVREDPHLLYRSGPYCHLLLLLRLLFIAIQSGFGTGDQHMLLGALGALGTCMRQWSFRIRRRVGGSCGLSGWFWLVGYLILMIHNR